MTVNPQTAIIVRHLSGSKINQVEHILLNGVQEVTIGRDPSCGIAYDGKRDDVVSRRHAAIRIEDGEKLAFRLVDFDSSNGTLLNGEQIKGEVELAPEDTIELGRGGPKFAFDVQPRPDYLASRTRVMNAVDASATRAMATATGTFEVPVNGNGTKELGATSNVENAVPSKPAVGKETVLRMLFQERQKSSRVLKSSVAAVLAVLLVGGGSLYWHNRVVASQIRDEAAQQAARARDDASASFAQQMGASAKEIVNKFGNSSVMVEMSWRMYDSGTGLPLFHKVVFDGKTREFYPAFIRLPDGKIVRWLTLKDQERRNIAIAGAGQGSGFVVSEQGHILTNKHVAAGWMMPFTDIGNSKNQGFIYPYRMDMKKQKPELAVLKSSAIEELTDWVPESGAYVFDADAPIAIGGDLDNRRVFGGRNDLLEVRFPGNRVSMNAMNVRASTDADTAIIKVESASPLKPVELAPDDKIEVGDKVVVLGYPAVSQKTLSITPTNEAGSFRNRREIVPEPTVSEGIISLIGAGYSKEGDVTVFGTVGDAYQMTINNVGHGNSGGPVFNLRGQVVGLFTYGDRDRMVTFAVPIKHGRALLNPQRASTN